MPKSRMLMLQHEKLAMAQSANFQFSSNYGLSELFNFRISAWNRRHHRSASVATLAGISYNKKKRFQGIYFELEKKNINSLAILDKEIDITYDAKPTS
mgnify:CR=1 FL=1